MKLALDVREACRPKRTGKGQWTYGFVSELLTRDCETLLLTDTEIPYEWKKHSPVVRCLSTGVRWHWQAASLLKKRKEVDLYISPTSYIVPFLLGSSRPFIPVVHDLIVFRGEPHDRKAKLIEHITMKQTLRHAKHVCVVSESTKRDIMDRYTFLKPENISVLYAGPMESSPLPNVSDHKTILCAATLSPRKNQLRLIQAYSTLSDELRSQYTLQLIGGRGWNDQEIVDLAMATEGVEWHDYVPVEKYNELLGTAHILALPSLYEGFGMQILDALQRGIPVLTSNRGSLPEVTEECAVLVDPESTESIAEGLTRMLTSKALQKDLRQSGPQKAAQFSWKRTTDLFLASLKQLQ